MNGKYHIGGYDYEICVYSGTSGTYRGVILIIAHAGVLFSPILEIPTPTHFMAERAARLEAESLAHQLINTGAIVALLPKEGVVNSSWPEETLFSPPLKH